MEVQHHSSYRNISLQDNRQRLATKLYRIGSFCDGFKMFDFYRGHTREKAARALFSYLVMFDPNQSASKIYRFVFRNNADISSQSSLKS